MQSVHNLDCESLSILQTRYDSNRGQYLFMTFVTLEPCGSAVASSHVRDSQSRIDLYTQVTFSLLEILVTGIVLHSLVPREVLQRTCLQSLRLLFTLVSRGSSIYDWLSSNDACPSHSNLRCFIKDNTNVLWFLSVKVWTINCEV